MPRDKKPTNWGQPGQTGFTKDGVPWYVPDKPPGFMEKMLYKVFPDDGTTSFPPGARFVPARTAAEVRERCLRKYRDTVASYLRDDEDIDGFIGFALSGSHIPQPPRGKLDAKVGPSPLTHWWMGGDWDTTAGKLLITIGGTRGSRDGSSVSDRNALWIRTSRRVVIMAGGMANPMFEHASYGLDQVGISPDWKPDTPGERERVDIAFADGSWLGLERHSRDIPGPTEDFPDRDLLAELVGPPVTGTVLPPIRG